MLVPVLLFLLGLALLIKGGDWFVDGSTDLARRFHVPEIIIGATVVAIGTTLPEVLVSATGALKGHSEIAYGNALGSVICNTALISAITFAVRPCKVDTKSFRVPVIFFFAAAVFYALNAYIGRSFSRLSGIVLLLVFAAYIAYTIWNGKKNGFSAAEEAEEAQVMEALSKFMPPMAAFSYMILNLFDPPCLVAMATTYREMGSRKWGLFAIVFQAILGYSLAFVVYNLGSWYIGDVPFGPMQGIALFLVAVALYFIFRPAKPYVKPQESAQA